MYVEVAGAASEVQPATLRSVSYGYAAAIALRIGSGIFRVSIGTIRLHGVSPWISWSFLDPWICGTSVESMLLYVRALASGPVLARLWFWTFSVSRPNLKSKPS